MIFYRVVVVLVFLIYFQENLIGQVANDACSGAYDLGSIDGQMGFSCPGTEDTCLIGTNINSSANYPYPSMSGCQGFSTSTGIAAHDVWYKFATPLEFTFLIAAGSNPTLDTLQLNIWIGDSCESICALGCYTIDSLSSSSIMDTISFMNSTVGRPDSIYFQISGSSTGSEGNFWLSLYGCSFCFASTFNFVCGPVPDYLCFNYDVSSTDASSYCTNDGTASVSINNGNPPYTFLWSDGNTDSIRMNLSGGNYFVTITDVNGCQEVDSVLIAQPSQLVMSFASWSLPSCYGNCDGSASLVAGGGTPPYSYAWSSGCISNICPSLCADTHTVMLTDSLGCQVSDSIIISQPDELVVTDSVIDVSCYGEADGSIYLTASGGTPFYMYSPSGGGSGIAAGTYVFTITDINGCMEIDTVVVDEPAEMMIMISGNPVIYCEDSCDAVLSAIVIGGFSPYSYQWNDSLTQTGQTATGLCFGVYILDVSDSNGCIGSVSASIGGPQSLVLITGSEADTSNSSIGFAWVSVSGGTAPYSFLWNDSLFQSTDTANGLSAGTYTVTVTDGNGCISIDSVTVEGYTSLVSHLSNGGVSLIPNPSNGYIMIIGLSGEHEIIAVYNALGKLVYQELLKGSMLNVSHLESGIYYARIGSVLSGNSSYKLLITK